jgi:epoxyqueuosine reductase
MTPSELTTRLKAEAVRIGFDQVGIAPAALAGGYPDFLRWLDAGHAAGMDYLVQHALARKTPESLLERARSVIMVSIVYGERESRPEIPPGSRPRHGKVARYARGDDYHRVLWRKLDELLTWLKVQVPEAKGRAVCDTAPLLERDYARLAGLGWIGKNTMLINRRLGSFTFLGALIVDIELTYDSRHETNHCGTCTRCLDACPTQAFAGPYELDARRCISYWTIEHRGPLEPDAQDQLNGWVFGCDICQDVCPWNRKAPAGREPAFHSRAEFADPDLIEWLERDAREWPGLLKGSALKRAKRAGLLRNAAMILGERRVSEAIPALAGRLDDSCEDPVIRAAAAWALGRMNTEIARESLARHRDDTDAVVQAAVVAARRQHDLDQSV